MPNYQPPFTLNDKILSLVATISESVGRLSVQFENQDLKLRRVNRMRSIQGSLAIEGNTLSVQQITAILDGKRVIAPPKEILEVQNAISAYDQLDQWQASNEIDLLAAHKTLMLGLDTDAGSYRNAGVGVMSGDKIIHMAPPADRVARLMFELFDWLAKTEVHPLVASCIFHYEFEFIHPFADGNGRMGRLWQTLILLQWKSVFTYLPVESLIHHHQDDYYDAIRQSTHAGDSAPFIEFLLKMINQAVVSLVSSTTQQPTQDTAQQKTKKLSTNQRAILEYLQNKPTATRKDLAEKIADITENGVKYNLKKLQQLALLQRIGSTKSGYWKVLK